MHGDPLNLSGALWGAMITHCWGVDYTNRFITDIPSVRDLWEKRERAYLQRLKGERLIGYVAGSLTPQERKFYYINRVDLPLEKTVKLIT